MQIDDFMERWAGSGGSEMATAQSFAIELTELRDVPRSNVSDKDGDFLDYRLGGVNLSGKAFKCVRKMVAGEKVTQETSGMSKGEWREFMAVVDG